MARKKPVFDADELLHDYAVYDRAVDVVSCFHWLFTQVDELADTVRHFDRYPRIPLSGDRKVTPDFTVVFTDGTGLAAEVANIAQREESVDSVCAQLQTYSELTEMPDAPGKKGGQKPTPVDPVDVLFLTSVKDAKDAARRILTERLDDHAHPFSPARRPVLAHYSQDSDAYVFLMWPDSANGTFARGTREVVYGDKDPFVCQPRNFNRNKVQYGFMNDNVKPLYMATRLWTQVLPNAFWTDSGEASVALPAVVEAVKEQSEGKGSTSDVLRGMQVLQAARLAKETIPDKEWTVTRQSLRRSSRDVADAIAERVRKHGPGAPVIPPPVRSLTRGSRTNAPDNHPTLFD